MVLAEKIVHLRKQRNLTQKEFAKSIGVHFSHISRYERGISLPSIDVVKKIARLCNVSTDYLLLNDTSMIPETQIPDPGLLRLFEIISHMHERERAALTIVLEGMVVKHQIEQLLKDHKTSAQVPSLLPSTAQGASREDANVSKGLLQHLNNTLDSVKRQPH